MLRKAMFIASICSALLSANIFAETLLIDNVNQASDKAPERGIEKSSVAEAYGEPDSQLGPVGEPPISSWEYDDVVIYFENDRVLHSVAKR